MDIRTYRQFCGLAYALDIIGGRWTLLIVRELMRGPRRFTDLMEALPGISTNLLTQRLKKLERQGVVSHRTLSAAGRAKFYELTAAGKALQRAVQELDGWGKLLGATPKQ
jgi:DNA-binding HxlR family transcriptional regulator